MYSIKDCIIDGLNPSEYDIKVIDFRDTLRRNKYLAKAYTLFMMGRDKQSKIQVKINKFYNDQYNDFKPDIVIVYNDEFLLPSTVEYFSIKSKIIFLLGDNPLYMAPTNIYNLSIMFFADLIVCPDSAWIKEMQKIGLKNIIFDNIAYNPKLFSSSNDLINKKRKNDILFVGRCYRGAWGYKRCLFLDHFSDLNLDIYGSGVHWNKWLKLFPSLKKNITLIKKKMPFEKMKELMHSYKVFPIDRSPGLISGVHLRVFECISAGILPLIVDQEDIPKVFEDIPLPIIRNYSECKIVAEEYLNDDVKRRMILTEAIELLNENYSPKIVMNRLMKKA